MTQPAQVAGPAARPRRDRGVHRTAISALAAVLALPAAGCGGSADNPAGRRAAAAEVNAPDGGVEASPGNYHLTRNKLERWVGVMEELAEVVRRDPGVGPRLGIHADEDLDGAAQRIARTPAARQVIEDAGLTVEEYLTINLALFQAILAHGALEAGQLHEIPAGVNRANVEFVAANRDFVDGISRRLRALDPRQK